MRVWPFKVNWDGGFNVTYEFWTEIIDSRSGKEQRIANRQTHRKRLEFESVAMFANRRRFDGFMQAWQNKPVIAPEVTRSVELTETIGAGAVEFDISEVTSWTVPGAYLVLEHDDRREFVRIFAVVGDAVQTTAPVVGAWPVGTTVYAGVLGRLQAEVSSANETDLVTRVSVALYAEPGRQPAEDDGEAAEVFNDREIFPFKPNWGDGINTDLLYPSDVLDYRRGRVSVIYPIEYGSRIRKATFVAKTKAEGEAFRAFFSRMAGQQDEFYLPSWSNDLPLKEAAAGGTMTFKTAGVEAAADYAEDTVYRAVCIVMKDDTVHYRTVTDVAEAGGDTVVTLGEALPAGGISPATVRLVSWMPACRLASDSLTIEWLTDSVAQAQMPIKTLEHLAGE